MMGSSLPCVLFWLLFLVAPACSLHPFPSSAGDPAPVIQDVIVGAPLTVRRSFGSFIETSPGAKYGELLSCIRLRVPGVPRLGNLHKYADSLRVKVEVLTQSTAQKVDICFHGNASLELGQCMKESWKTFEKGLWIGMMSPFETRFLDIRIRDSITDIPLTVTVDEEFWPFRVVFLGLGLLLLLIAPLVSSWVPFYYSSGMTLGVFLIILVLLFQGMKLLPTGRKSTLYIVLYGSVVGMGTVILHYFTGLISSVLKEIGISDEAYNPVAVFLLVGVVLMGAWLGYWGVRKLVLSEEGTVDIGTAQFVKWALRILGCVMILQSSHDPLLAIIALSVGIFLTWISRKVHLQDLADLWDTMSLSWPEFLSFEHCNVLWKKSSKMDQHANISKTEFLHKDDAKLLRSPTGSLFRTPAPVSSSKLVTSRSTPVTSALSSAHTGDHFSSYHKTPTKKHMSPREWADFTQHYTRKAMQDLATSPKFATWFADNSDRVLILPTEHRVDRSVEEIQTTAHMVQADEGEGRTTPHLFGFK